MGTQNSNNLIKEKAEEPNRIYEKEQKNPVAAAVGFWFLGLVSCLLPIIIPRAFFSFSLLPFLTAIFAPVIFIIIGAFHYKNKVFNKKEEIIKSLKHFRIAYILLWVLFIASIIASIIFMGSCVAWNCLVVIAIAPIIVAIFTYAVTFAVIALKLKKKL